MLEAKALLKLKDATIQEISNRLGFPDQSTFGKYFKRHAGVSPKEYVLHHKN
jgi:AraC-like DNA-binding protein